MLLALLLQLKSFGSLYAWVVLFSLFENIRAVQISLPFLSVYYFVSVSTKSSAVTPRNIVQHLITDKDGCTRNKMAR